jgi:hypothetical protein
MENDKNYLEIKNSQYYSQNVLKSSILGLDTRYLALHSNFYHFDNFINENKANFKLVQNSYVISSSAEFVSGYFAACTSIILLFPLNKLIFRQILEGTSFKDAFTQLRSEGINQIYRGLLPPLLQKSIAYSIMFGSQNEYNLILNKLTDASKSNFIQSFNPSYKKILLTTISAALAGFTEATLTPFERIQAVLQMKTFGMFRNTWNVFQEIWKNYGLKELYRGYTALCLRNSLSNILFFTSRTPLKAMFPKTNNRFMHIMYDFINGALLGACISTIFYPFNIIKSHMQAKIGGKYFGIYQSFKLIYELRDRKFSKFYKGVGSNFLRAIFAWGITNSSYEFSLNNLSKRKHKSSLD